MLHELVVGHKNRERPDNLDLLTKINIGSGDKENSGSGVVNHFCCAFLLYKITAFAYEAFLLVSKFSGTGV
jgi:hypothetical protein